MKEFPKSTRSVEGSFSEEEQQHRVFPKEKGQMKQEIILPPLSVILEVTNECNLCCVYCLNSSGPSPEDTIDNLDKYEIFDLIDQLSAMGTVSAIVSGGEPFLREDLFEILEYTHGKLSVGLSTNGYFLDKGNVTKLLSVGVAGVNVDIHSCDPDVHDSITGKKGSFRRAVQGIENCLEAGIKCGVNTTLTRMNLSTMNRMVDSVLDLKVDYFIVNKFIPIGRGKLASGNLALSAEEYKKAMVNLYKKKEELKDKLPIQICHDPHESVVLKQKTHFFSGCIAGLGWCRITSQGYVYACPFLPITLGNIREKNLKDIWKNSPVLKKLRTKENLKGECSICGHKYDCGGCRANAYAYKKDFLASDPYCYIQQ